MRLERILFFTMNKFYKVFHITRQIASMCVYIFRRGAYTYNFVMVMSRLASEKGNNFCCRSLQAFFKRILKPSERINSGGFENFFLFKH